MSSLTLVELLHQYLNQYNLTPSRENNLFVIGIIKERRRYLDQRIQELRQELDDSLRVLNEIRTDNALLIQQRLWIEDDAMDDNQIDGNLMNANQMNINQMDPNQNHGANDQTMIRLFRRYG